MSQQQVHKTYARRLFLAAVAYVVLLVGVSVLVTYVLPETALNILLALLPVLPILFGLWSYSQFLEGLDELQRHIQTKAIVLAAGVTGIFTTSYGFLEAYAGFPPINFTWVFPLMIMLWGLGQAYYGRKYG